MAISIIFIAAAGIIDICCNCCNLGEWAICDCSGLAGMVEPSPGKANAGKDIVPTMFCRSAEFRAKECIPSGDGKDSAGRENVFHCARESIPSDDGKDSVWRKKEFLRALKRAVGRDYSLTKRGSFARMFRMLQGTYIAAMFFWAVALGLVGALAARAALDMKERIDASGVPGDEAFAEMPLAMRILFPFVRGASGRDRPQARLAAQLSAAGMDEALTPEEFRRLSFVFPCVWSIVWIVPCKLFGDLTGFEASWQMLLWLAGALFFALYPGMWLRSLVKRRHLAIVKTLPFVLDVLTLSVEAGLDFMGALQRYCEKRSGAKAGVLERELARMLREIQIGYPRKAALGNLARRNGEPNLRGVAHALIQADELGVGVGAVLRIESDQLRARRFDRAEKLANEAPVKMLGPLLLCIFPAVFVILLGPVLVSRMF